LPPATWSLEATKKQGRKATFSGNLEKTTNSSFFQLREILSFFWETLGMFFFSAILPNPRWAEGGLEKNPSQRCVQFFVAPFVEPTKAEYSRH